MKIINKLKTYQHLNSIDAKYVLSIIPKNIIDDNPDTIDIIGTQYGQSKIETFHIDKLFYSQKVKSIIAEALTKSHPIRILCIRPNPVLKPNIYKVCKIQTQDGTSHDWIDIQHRSKIFLKQTSHENPILEYISDNSIEYFESI